MPTKRQLEMVKSLRIAKKRLERSDAWFICHALGCAHLKELPHAKILRVWIQKQLQGQHTYGDWLRVNHPEIADIMTDYGARDARIQWVDAMIEELLK